MGEQLAAELITMGIQATMEMSKQQQQTRAARDQIERQHLIATERLRQQYAMEERARRDRQRKDEAVARVRFGAAGIAPAEGSAAAMLRGLDKAADRDTADRLHLYALDRAEANDRLAWQQRDLLQTAQDNLQKKWFSMR
ncbi:MAG: hypothetical protein AB7G39_03640 [Alphaproteobacteria bacterium]